MSIERISISSHWKVLERWQCCSSLVRLELRMIPTPHGTVFLTSPDNQIHFNAAHSLSGWKPPPQNTSAAAGWLVCDVSKHSKRTREEKDPVLGSSASPVLLYTKVWVWIYGISIYRGSWNLLSQPQCGICVKRFPLYFFTCPDFLHFLQQSVPWSWVRPPVPR